MARESFSGRNRTRDPHAKRGGLILPEISLEATSPTSVQETAQTSQCSMKEGPSREAQRACATRGFPSSPRVFIVALSQTIVPDTVVRASKIETSLGRCVCLLAARLLPTSDGDIGTSLWPRPDDTGRWICLG